MKEIRKSPAQSIAVTAVLVPAAMSFIHPVYTPAVLCQNHGPFVWGKDAAEAVHNAVVLEEVAKMACRTELINPRVTPAPDSIKEKHFMRKHGANAYYGQ